MKLEISKRYFSSSFHRIPPTRYGDIAYHMEMQAVIRLGNQPSFTKFMAL